MAAAKGKPKTTKATARSTHALDAGAKAFGAKLVREGFAASAEMDLAFALGFPHLRYVTDDAADPDPKAAAQAAIDKYGHDARLVWPRASAIALIRASFGKAFAVGGEPNADEGHAMAKARMDFGGVPDRFVASFSIQLLEALVGTTAVVDGMLEGLDARVKKLPIDGSSWGEISARQLGYLLLRLPAADAERARKRLEAFIEPTKKGGDEDVGKTLDLVLHGRAGAERSGYKPDPKGPLSAFDLGHIIDDGKFVADQLVAGKGPDVSSWPDARLAFLGGEPAIAYYEQYWPKFKNKGGHGYIVATFGEIAPKRIRPIMEAMVTGSSAKKDASAWVQRNG
jgi:hypothetical protein